MNNVASATMVIVIRRGLTRRGITPDIPAKLTTSKATIPPTDKRQLLIGIYEWYGELEVA